MQRLRITFSKGEEIRYITHLDLMRLWERALRRAQIALAYSQGFNPQPRLSLAAPLAVGVTSGGEVLDVTIAGRVGLRYLLGKLEPQLPRGIAIHEVEEVGLRLPSLQSEVRFAQYRVMLPPAICSDDAERRMREFLATKELPRQLKREAKIKSYDLRPLVDNLWLEADQEGTFLGMRLRTDSSGAGRPDEVLRALGLDPFHCSIHRSRLEFAWEARPTQ